MTEFNVKVKILSDLWTDHHEDHDMADFFTYNDLGLPLAFMINQKIVESTPVAQVYIEETFELLLESLGIDSDEEYESLDEMFDMQNTRIENKIDTNSDKFNEIISAAIQEMENSNLKIAEELLVDAHEKARNASDIDSSALMIIEKILIPQSRFRETEMWIRSIVSTNKRQELRSKLKEIEPVVRIKRATEHDDWKSANISNAIQKSSDQQYFYDRFVKYSSAQDPETLNRDTMSTWPGPGFYGFLSGFFEGNKAIFQMGCERETIALAIFDFYNFVMEDPLGSEERNPDIHDAPYQNYSEEQILKLCEKNDPWALKQYGLLLDKRGESDSALKYWTKAAKLGNHTSMRNLGLTAFKNGKSKEAISYLQNAIEAGSRTSHHLLATIYEQTNPELVEKTLLEGMKLLDVAAINHLGTLNQNEKKWDEAIYYYRKAAEYGDFVAMANLANVLFKKEPDQSLIWLIRAEDKYPLESQKIISYLRKKLLSGTQMTMMPYKTIRTF
jgi:TPR repeat protein